MRFTILFGPSRAWDAQRAQARAGATRLTELTDGSHRAEFVLAQDPETYLAFESTLRLLIMVRGTEVWKEGLPMSLGQALRTAREARQQLRPAYVVPPPRDLVTQLVDDLTDGEGRSDDPQVKAWTDHWPEG